MASFQISESIDINRSADDVYQYVADIAQHPEWRPNVTIRDYSGEPFAVGTSWNEVTKFMGREMVVDLEVTALEEGRQIKAKQDGGGVSGIMTMQFSPGQDDGSTFTLSFDGEMSGWLGRLTSGILSSQASKDMRRDLSNLKASLETN